MQSLDEIKRRIRSIQTTSKITGAMKLVATAKMKKLMNQFKKINVFCQDFYHIIETLVESEPLDSKNEPKRNLWILISSSLGLCGAFNINICKHLMAQVQPNDKIIVVGRKGYAYLKSHGLAEHIIEYVDFSDNALDYLEVLPLCEEIVGYFNSHEFTHIHLVYTKFINSLTFNPLHIQLLPFDRSLFKMAEQNKRSHLDLDEQNKVIEYEPNKADILKSSLSIFITTSLYAAIYESRVCENGSRRNAMETATDNAKELIDELTLEFNEVRQQNITQEINEIVAGADGSSI